MSDQPDLLTTSLLWDLPRVGPPAASPDGSVVVVPVTTHAHGTPRTVLWLVSEDAEPVPVTRVDASSSAPTVAPDGAHVAFGRTVDEQRQLFVLPLSGGEARQVTDLPLGVLGSARWVDSHRLLVVTRLLLDDPTPAATAAWRDDAQQRPNVLATERRVSRVWDTWHVDPLTDHVLMLDLDTPDADPVDLTPGEWLLPDPLMDPGAHVDVSADGTTLAFTTTHPDGDEDGVPVPCLHVVPVAGGAVRCLTADDRGAAGAPRFLPDGRIAVTIQRERDFYAAPVDLWSLDPADGSRIPLLTDVDHGLDSVSVGADGRIVIAAELRGRARLLEVIDGDTVPLPTPPTGGLSAPYVTSAGTLAVHASLTEPPEVVRVDADNITLLTGMARHHLDGMDLGRVEERTVAGADGDDVQVLVLHPPSAAVSGDGPPPLVHLIHGGPHGTFADTWQWRWCAARFAADGFVTALVNFHGSTSFGHDFTRSIHGDWATKPTADVLAATDDLIADGTVDPNRTAIAGGSYGGYLTTWLCTQTDRFTTAVAHAAVTDFGGMWASDWTSGIAGSFGGSVALDPAATYRFSPSWHYANLRTPMLVLHGERDLRVPIDQGRALFGVLQELRIESRLVVFPDENHWVLDRRRSERWYSEVLGWLHRFLDV